MTEEDAPSYEKNFVDWEIIGQLGAVVPWPYPSGGVLEFIRSHILPQQGKDKWVWAIVRKSAHREVIGVVDLWRKGSPENRGFWLARSCWGQGYMTEAVEAVTDYAFGTLGFEKLVFANALGNTRSRRVKERTGARFIRTEPRRFVNPAYSQTEIWELTKADWERWKSGKKLKG